MCLKSQSLSQEEVGTILEVASKQKNHPMRSVAMILLGYKHGMRASEICGLRLADIDLRNHEITVKRLKGSLETTQPLADEAGQKLFSERKILKAYLKERAAYVAKRGITDGHVFISAKGGALNRVTFHKIFYRLAELAGIDKDRRHPHCLKHAIGFTMSEAGCPLQVIQQHLGHASIGSAAIYSKPSKQVVSRLVSHAIRQAFRPTV